ncbi:hypothetical protein ACH5RR_032352 [Cinchona calisaya]|uniref:Uncharacterized protein n=1 Tax=Cinchona calisaya TaxID=153742 RepID=A0ABD2YLB8_9GENT
MGIGRTVSDRCLYSIGFFFIFKSMFNVVINDIIIVPKLIQKKLMHGAINGHQYFQGQQNRLNKILCSLFSHIIANMQYARKLRKSEQLQSSWDFGPISYSWFS